MSIRISKDISGKTYQYEVIDDTTAEVVQMGDGFETTQEINGYLNQLSEALNCAEVDDE